LIETQNQIYILLGSVDILASDKLGKLGCTLDGCKRDELVFELCSNTKFCTSFYGRWLSPDIKTIIEAHANTYRAAIF
jgi:hypothetical protein